MAGFKNLTELIQGWREHFLEAKLIPLGKEL